MKPENFEEKLIWYSIIGTYIFYFAGFLYFLGPIIGYTLLFYLTLKIWRQQKNTPENEKIFIPLIVWVWVAGMLVEQLALIMGHIDFNLSIIQIIKSSFGWAKGWALLAVFPLIGCLKIRPQLLYRAICIVSFHSLVLIPICYLAYLLKLNINYTSPLSVFGGGGDLYFQVQLYNLKEALGEVRFPFFAPWGPALGMVGNIYFSMVLQEKNLKWRWCGIVACILLCYLSKSRMAAICLPITFLISWGISALNQPIYVILLGFVTTLLGIIAPTLLSLAGTFWSSFKDLRADSTRVRETLQRIALNRFKEAPIWGHGVIDEGPQLVASMPIGSHHTVFSLLYIKGIVGLIAYFIPLFFSFFDLLIKSKTSNIAKVGLNIIIILCFYSFGENLEVLSYLFWPGLVLLGMAFKERQIFLKHSASII